HNGLPPLVILLACGSDTGNLIHYGRKLLAHGARTLIAPFGRLDARAARDFLVQFLPRWSTGWRADTALQAAQARDETGWGARR
ncbi:CHAT domain-containing protein, partial [Citrobacter sp. AAK_AS5]